MSNNVDDTHDTQKPSPEIKFFRVQTLTVLHCLNNEINHRLHHIVGAGGTYLGHYIVAVSPYIEGSTVPFY